MRTQTHRFAFGVALVAVVCLLAGQGGAGEKAKVWKQFLPPETYQELVTRAAKAMDAALTGEPDEAALKRAQFHALMIAGYALSAIGGKDVGTTQDMALKAAKVAGEKNKVGQARMYAAALLKGMPKGGPKRKELTDPKAYVASVDELMEHFRTKMKGGEGIPAALQSNARLKGTQNGIEEKLRGLAKRKLADGALAKEADELALLGYRAAVVGELTYFYTPKARVKDWHEHSLAMRDAGIALAEAAQKKDAAGVFQAGTRLNESCAACHMAARK